jgi:hypothetical protein
VSLAEFVPQNGLEHAILAARQGTLTEDAMVAALLSARLSMSSLNEVASDGSGFEPLLFGGRGGEPQMGVYSSPDRATLHHERARFLLEMDGIDLFRRIPPGYGVVLNPGYAAQMIIPASGVAQVQRDAQAFPRRVRP